MFYASGKNSNCSKTIKLRFVQFSRSTLHGEWRFLTSVCTMCGLCSLRLFTVWKTSRIPSAFTRSRTVLRAQNVPVRPAPALFTHKQQLLTAVCILRSLFLLFLIGWPWIPTGHCSSICFIITECFGDVTMDRFWLSHTKHSWVPSSITKPLNLTDLIKLAFLSNQNILYPHYKIYGKFE